MLCKGRKVQKLTGLNFFLKILILGRKLKNSFEIVFFGGFYQRFHQMMCLFLTLKRVHIISFYDSANIPCREKSGSSVIYCSIF